MKKITILGSTGSIGCSALDVVEKNPDRFQIVALAAGENIKKLKEQIEKFFLCGLCVLCVLCG